MNVERPMRFGLVFLGLCFFFNPGFSAVDVLPDFIGCMLIWLGLSRISLISTPMREARSAFLKLAVVDVIKTLALMMVFRAGSSSEQPISLLIIAFSVALLGTYFFVGAIRTLFDGFATLGMAHDVLPLYQTHFHGRSRVEEITRFSILFYALREGICLLPEATALSITSFEDRGLIPLYDYIGIMRLLACFVVLIFGVIYLVRILRFFALIRREREFLSHLGKRCDAHLQAHPGIAVLRRHFAAFFMLSVGAFLLADFQIDFRNVIPDGAAAACLCLGVLLLDVPNKCLQGITAVLAVAYGIVASISSDRAYVFNSNYGVPDAAHASDAHFALWLSALLEFLVFLALAACICWLLHGTVRRYAGYLPESQSDFELDTLEELRGDLDRGLIRSFAVLAMSALASFFFDYIKEIPYDGFWHILEFYWFFDFVVAVLSAAVFLASLASIYREIQNRYRFD